MLRILILVFALGSGGIAAWLALGASEQPAAEAAVVANSATASTRDVLVASADLGHGTTLEEAHMRWQPWTGDNVPSVFVSRTSRPDAPEAFKGSLVRSGFVAGEPIREDRLAKPGAGFLSGMLPSGKRAIAVRITAESTAGGFILPNDRVDIIHTVVRAAQPGGNAQVSSRTILSNLRVLAVDQSASDSAEGAAVVGKTATLEVEPEQIAVITEAEASGSVSLALRATADIGETPAIANKEDRKGVVRIVGGGRSTLIEVEASRFDGS
jgi:pilus assembly protein CpaB